MKKYLLSLLFLALSSPVIIAGRKALPAEAAVKYPVTTAIFYGSGIDTSREWNICTGATDGGVVITMVQRILPIQNCKGDYVVVRTYTDQSGRVVKRSLRRLSSGGAVPV